MSLKCDVIYNPILLTMKKLHYFDVLKLRVSFGISISGCQVFAWVFTAANLLILRRIEGDENEVKKLQGGARMLPKKPRTEVALDGTLKNFVRKAISKERISVGAKKILYNLFRLRKWPIFWAITNFIENMGCSWILYWFSTFHRLTYKIGGNPIKEISS